MRYKTLTILLLMSFWPAIDGRTEVKYLSPGAKISLLTCGPGEAIYSKFGHSALWVFDPAQRIDRVYNYGTFDFYSNDFYIEFVKGTAKYRLSVTNFQTFFEEYEGENRSIVGQELNLTSYERQVLFDKLEENYKPENRYYLYDFLFQNCSSLIRDIVWEATEGRFTIPKESDTQHSYRSMMIPYLSVNPWLMNGEFILLGHKTDRNANPWDQMYLPDYMFDWFEAASNSDSESLVSKTQTHFLPRPENEKKSILTHPIFLLTIVFLFVIYMTVREIRRKRNIRLIDSTLFFLTGLMGIFMVFMWTSSEHLVTHQNINLVWAFPFHLVIVFLVWIKGAYPFVRLYAKVMAPLSIIFLCFFWILPQEIPSVAIFASAIISVRLIRWAYYPGNKN